MHRSPFQGAIRRFNAEQIADTLAMAVVVSLPWSTSLTASLIGLWLLSTLPFLHSSRLHKSVAELRRSVITPAGALPVLLWLIAALGMLCADVSWHERLRGFTGFHKLLLIPCKSSEANHTDRAALFFAGRRTTA